MATQRNRVEARRGDWLEAHGLHGGPPRRGEVIELMGGLEHEHYRVRWDDGHESIVYPDDGVLVVPRGKERAVAR